MADSKSRTRSMQAQGLRRLIDADTYKPDPSLVAVAILRRPALMELLLPATKGAPLAADEA